MAKIKVLVLSLDNDGVGYYRMNSPYLTLNDPDIEVKFLSNSDFTFRFTEDVLKEFNVIVYHKGIPFRDQKNAANFVNVVNKYGIKIVYEIDDHWELNPSHINYKNWKKNNSKQTTINHIKGAHYVTTTTSIFADEIKEINPNVVVLENAINHKEHQWIPNKVESEKTRFIWGGGISHYPDLALLTDSFRAFDKDFLSKIQMYMCGFDLRMKGPNGQISMDNPNRSMWGKFESIFTNRLKWIRNSEYSAWLREYTDIERDIYGYNEEFKDEYYQRRWTKPIFLYGTQYNEADVGLAPLKEFRFNAVKSQLKVIEAGIHQMPIIASNFGPYTIDVIDGKHGFLVDEGDKLGWYEKMKYFVDNPNAIEDMGMALNELVLEKYTLEKINKKRAMFLKSIAV